MLGEVVTAGEALGAERTGEALLPRVRPVVAGQLVGACELLVTAWPVTGKGALTWREEAEDRDSGQWGGGEGTGRGGLHIRSQSILVNSLAPPSLVLEAEFWV